MNDGDRGNIQFDLLTREPLEVILNPNYKGKNEIKVFDEKQNSYLAKFQLRQTAKGNILNDVKSIT